MLTIQGGTYLPAIEFGFREDRDLCIAEIRFGLGSYALHRGLEDPPAQGIVGLDLNRSPAVRDNDLLFGAALHGCREPKGGQGLRYTGKGRINIGDGCSPIVEANIGKIDIDRQTGHVAIEEVDSCTAFEGEARLPGDEGKGLHKKSYLIPVCLSQISPRSPTTMLYFLSTLPPFSISRTPDPRAILDRSRRFLQAWPARSLM